VIVAAETFPFGIKDGCTCVSSCAETLPHPRPLPKAINDTRTSLACAGQYLQ
jgi:hypothetical protein